MKHIPLILLISFLAGLFALWFSIYEIVLPLRRENITLKRAFTNFENPETEIIRDGKIFEIVEKY